MASHDVGFDDIFKGSEEVEILEATCLLVAYIDNARRLVQDLEAPPDDHSLSVRKVEKVLDILNSAADHLRNKDLKTACPHSQMLQALTKEGLQDRRLVDSFTAGLMSLEEIAGNDRRPAVRVSWTSGPRARVGQSRKNKDRRSADIIVNVDILNDVRSIC